MSTPAYGVQQPPQNPQWSEPSAPIYYPPIPRFDPVTGQPIYFDQPPAYDDVCRAPSTPPSVQARAAIIAKTNFSVPAALISSGATLVVSCAVGMSAPAVLATTLLAGGVFGFLGTLEPTVIRVQHYVPSVFKMNWFGIHYSPATTFETTVVTDWTDTLGVFLRTLIAVNIAMKEAKKEEERNTKPAQLTNNVTHIHNH